MVTVKPMVDTGGMTRVRVSGSARRRNVPGDPVEGTRAYGRSVLVLAFAALQACASHVDTPVESHDATGAAPGVTSPALVVPSGFVVLPLFADEEVNTNSEIEIAAGDYECSGLGEVDDCEQNSEPLLGDPFFLVNGELYAELPVLSVEDQVSVLVSADDSECNLACGLIAASVEGGGPTDSAVSLPSNVSCSTTKSNVYIGVNLSRFMLEQVGSVTLRLVDRCSAPSSAMVLSPRFH
jgi:hypothetical protein